MTSREWENVAKYFFDLSKLTISITVIGQFVTKDLKWNAVAMGMVVGICLFVAGRLADRKGEKR